MGDTDDEVQSVLIDVSGLSLQQIRSLDGKVLGEALQRIHAEAANPREAVAGFSNVMPPVDSGDRA
ncbi:FxSxx-COOH cyclophane-containing RiPP peptide [Actinomadura scrupuli]|uniref:FxSxx-COOH cyclophane-containing RiPP peptide n=1 Tax=Actinomadura scrupuli TaxID=559629 RepID=UPI003D96F42E